MAAHKFLFLLAVTLMSKTIMAKDLQILALGDSYTIGESVTENERWPNQLQNILVKQGIKASKPVIIARTGWTTANLYAAIKSDSSLAQFDIVTVLIGVNDQFQGYSVNSYKKGFKAVLELAVMHAGGNPAKVVVLSIPDYSVTPFAQRFNPQRIANELTEFNKLNRKLSHDEGVHYIDITAISQQAAHQDSLLANDGLHPSGLMYQHWAEKTLPVIKRILKKQ